MKNKWLVINTGFALFSMFFGSGNLVFPITVGQQSEGHYLLAALGIIFTGVIIPFLGVFGMILYRGDIRQFFSSFGQKGLFVFSFCSLALMGPFGVLARCLTVAHGALLNMWSSLSLPIASLLMCIIIYFLAINQTKMLSRLGTVLTPLLLLAIMVIGLFGIKNGIFPQHTSLNGLNALKNGFFQGYQTMDLLAAFFFTQFVVTQLCKYEENHSNSIKLFFKSSLIGAGLLSFIYFILVLLGWIYSSQLVLALPQEMLGIIAIESLGPLAAPVICLAVLFACLTTAIVLTSLFADFLRVDVSQNKLGNKLSLVITLAIGFLVSTFDFNGIAKFLGPILENIYPALIAMTIVNIILYFKRLKNSEMNI